MQGRLSPTFPYENKTEQGKNAEHRNNKGKDLKGWIFTLNTLILALSFIKLFKTIEYYTQTPCLMYSICKPKINL